MKRIVGFCATLLLVIAGLSLGASSNGRIVMGQTSHTDSFGNSEGVQSSIDFSTPGEETISIETDFDGTYTATVKPSKQYTCTASNEYGSQTKTLKSSTETATLNFDF